MPEIAEGTWDAIRRRGLSGIIGSGTRLRACLGVRGVVNMCGKAKFIRFLHGLLAALCEVGVCSHFSVHLNFSKNRICSCSDLAVNKGDDVIKFDRPFLQLHDVIHKSTPSFSHTIRKLEN